MHMLRLLDLMAHLDGLYPAMRDDLLNRRAVARIRLEHAPHQAPARARVQVVDRRRAAGDGGVRVRARRGVCAIERIGGGLCGAPGEFLEVQAVVDDPASPDIDESGVVGYRSPKMWFEATGEDTAIDGKGWQRQKSNKRKGRSRLKKGETIRRLACNLKASDVRFPKNCSGAIYGSLPHRPVDIWTVASQGKRYTVEAP